MKKLLALVLVTVMVLSSVVTVIAANADSVPTRENPAIGDFDGTNGSDYAIDFWLSDATIAEGTNTAQVTLNVKNNIGFGMATVHLIYPSCLEVKLPNSGINVNKRDPWDETKALYTTEDLETNLNATAPHNSFINANNNTGFSYNGMSAMDLVNSGEYILSTISFYCEQKYANEFDEDEGIKTYNMNFKDVDCELLTFTFTYDESKNPTGKTELPIILLINNADSCINVGEGGRDNLIFTPYAHYGSITVPVEEKADPTITVSDATIVKGTPTAEFEISVENNPGVFSIVGLAVYDPAMKLVGFENGNIFEKFFQGGPLAEGNERMLNQTVADMKSNSTLGYDEVLDVAGISDDYLCTIFQNLDGDIESNITTNGTYCKFALDTSELDEGTYPIMFLINSGSTINVAGDDVYFDVVQGTLTVTGCDHEWVLTDSVDATCTTDRVETYACSKCGTTDVRTIEGSALGHDHQVESVENATCTKPEVTTYKCSRCDDTYKEETAPANGHSYNAAVTAPTCTDQGYTTYTCAVCDDKYVDAYVDALGHDWIQGETTGNCGEIGTVNYTCSRCGETKTEEGALIDHVWEQTDKQDPTCTEKGHVDYTCSKCNETKTEEIDALGHNETATIVAPKCTEKGYTIYTCERCGNIEFRDYVDELEHDMVEVERVHANCTENGHVNYECSRCDEAYVETLESLGHDYKDVVTDPTCTEQGYTTHTCTRCDDTYVDTYVPSKGGHKYTTVVTNPTCTEQGYTTHTCSVCGDTYKDSYVDAKGHDYVETVIPPTCTEGSHTTYTCSVCGNTNAPFEVEEAPALGHDYVGVVTAPTCTEKGYTTYTCSRCDETYVGTYVDAIGHEYETEGTEVAPTCTEEGYTGYKCVRCDAVDKRDVVDALGHAYDDGVVTKAPTASAEGEKTYTCSVCGDKKTEAIAKLAPEVVVGTGSKWTVGSGKPLAFQSSASVEDFESIEIDGKLVAPENYTVKEDGTIEIKEEFLKTLGAGEHTITINSKTGAAKASFNVEAAKAEETAKPTGDTFALVAFIASLALVSGAAIVVAKKKKIFNR